jgi:hypothetical protein
VRRLYRRPSGLTLAEGRRWAAMRTVSLDKVTRSVSLSAVSSSEVRKSRTATVAVSQRAVCVLAFVVTVFCAGLAWADPISFSFLIDVTSADEFTPNALSRAFGGTAPAPGTQMRAVFTAKETTPPPDLEPLPDAGEYPLTGNWTFFTGRSTSRYGIPNQNLSVTTVRVIDSAPNSGHSDEFDLFYCCSAAPDPSHPDIQFLIATVMMFGDNHSLTSDRFPIFEGLKRLNDGSIDVAGLFQDNPCGGDPDTCSDFNVVGSAHLTGAVTPTPEPMSVLLFGPAALALAARRWTNRKHAG